MSGENIDEVLDGLDENFARLHTAKEDAFWRAKMGLGADAAESQAELDVREVELSRFLRDPKRLELARRLVERAPKGVQLTRAQGWLRTFEAHVIAKQAARELAEELTIDEGRLELLRGEMTLGYVDPEQGSVAASAGKLSAMLRSDASEARRKAAWQGLRSIEPFLLERGFLELVQKRNRLAQALGAEDYYDWKARRVEGLSKREIFELLADLEARTRDAGRRFVEQGVLRHGADAMQPWNMAFNVFGDSTRELDPYYGLESVVERWGRVFSALGVRYAGASLVLDLLDRPGKYENGFMHGPVVAWRRGAQRIPARVQFTANAIPGVLGSGHDALKTLLHEGGHAAHFANVDMPSPCFGQEFAPTSAAFAETQSMFFDHLLGDADFRARYARDPSGAAMPDALIERGIEVEQPAAAWRLRATLLACFAEKAIYEQADSLDRDGVLALLRGLERDFLFLEAGSPRPVLSIPHLSSRDFSAYVHSYVLARMAVAQAREHFVRRDGAILDNARVGAELATVWWQPGNSVSFADMVKRLTGRALGAGPLAAEVSASVDESRKAARATLARLHRSPTNTAAVELDAAIRIVDGHELVAEFAGDFATFSDKFGHFIRQRRQD
jgi:hypothetical protein